MKVPSRVDTLFVGGGGASYPGAFELAKAGQSVLMVDDKGNLGATASTLAAYPLSPSGPGSLNTLRQPIRSTPTRSGRRQ